MRQTVSEIILTGNSQKKFSGNFFYYGTVKIAILSPQCHIEDIFTEIYYYRLIMITQLFNE